MISFIWSPGLRLPAGTGGSENYTIGQVRELTRRRIPAQIVTTGLGTDDGREEFPGIPFLALPSFADVATLDGTVIFVASSPNVPTQKPSYQMLHIPPPLRSREKATVLSQLSNRGLIATSQFAAGLWAEYLDVDIATVQVVYPFAEPVFSRQSRPATNPRTIRVLFAGRLSPEKGIYTLLATLHSDLITELSRQGIDISFTVTTAGADKPQGKIIEALLTAHQGVRLVTARRSPAAMAELMAEHDIVVMPSNSQYWHETFGIVSVEAQHSGCRVVASDDGGLPETNCGSITLVAPDNAEELAQGIREAISLGQITVAERAVVAEKFTVTQSVNELLAVLDRPRPATPAEVIEQLEVIASLPSPMQHPAPFATTLDPIPVITESQTMKYQPQKRAPHGRQIPQTAEFEKSGQIPERKAS